MRLGGQPMRHSSEKHILPQNLRHKPFPTEVGRDLWIFVPLGLTHLWWTAWQLRMRDFHFDIFCFGEGTITIAPHES